VTLGRAGHTVIATMRNLTGGAELQDIASKERLPIALATLDVDDDISVKDAFDKVLAEHGRVDILVNNAGIGGGGAVEEAPLAVFRQVMETNFFGGLRCIKAVVPGMRERRHGCVVNVTSIAGRVAMAPQASYAASKWAFEALSECLAQEMKAFNVRVAIIEPGVIATPIFGKARPLPNDSPYPHSRRLRAWFRASLSTGTPTSPYVVAEQIREIVDGDSWRLRYTVGADAAMMLQWRAGRTDEEVIESQSATDAQYVAGMKELYGFDIVL
jgi:NAD(P)-dependent dehydrogenase (short-subunit alcohol dehydrogenase family)